MQEKNNPCINDVAITSFEKCNKYPEMSANSYEELKSWLENDLGEFEADIEYVKPYLIKLVSDLEQSQSRENYSSSDNLFIKDLVELKDKCINGSLNKNQLNKILKKIFVSQFFNEKCYESSLEEILYKPISQTVSDRVNYPQPIPTLDVMVAFKNDKRIFGQVMRAARLTKAMTDMAQEINNNVYNIRLSDKNKTNPVGLKYLFGATVSSRKDKSYLVINNNADYIVVLIDGQCYRVQVINENKETCRVVDIYNQMISLLEHHRSQKELGKLHYPIGAFSASVRENCYKARKRAERKNMKNKLAFDELDNALFTIALDFNTEQSSMPNYQKAFIGNYHNRWFGSTQLIVDSFENVSVLCSYIKGGGSNLAEFADEVYQRADALSPFIDRPSGDKFLTKKLEFDIHQDDAVSLLPSIEKIQANAQCVHAVGVGHEHFKRLGVSPNIAMHYLLTVAIMQLTDDDYLPAVNQALEINYYSNESVQGDWVYTSLKSLVVLMKNYSNTLEKKDRILNDFKLLATKHVEKLKMARQGLSPTYLVKHSESYIHQCLIDFFFEIGNAVPAYRNYLFRMCRKPGAIDIMTSSLKLPNNVDLLSRPGILLNVFNILGVHIMMSSRETKFCFMPNKEWSERLPSLMQELNKWISIIS